MRWKMLVVGMLAAGGVAAEVGASSLGNLPQGTREEAAVAIGPGAAPSAPADLVLPPHLTGGLPDLLRWAPGAQGLPTLQDLVVASPTYVAPPPTRHRARQHGGRRH